jgi:aminopeptidase N
MIHMLREMMYDLDKQSDRTFLKFLQELSSTVNNRQFNNADFIRVAEKYAGTDLDSFFALWLYGIGVPEYSVNYSIVPKESQWAVDVSVTVDKVSETFSMPVIIRIANEDGSNSFVRQTITGKQASFQLGPFAAKPKEIVFNEFASVLSKDKVSKAKA